MSEDERTKITAQDEQSDEVEAHGKHGLAANDETTEGDDDFEAHGKHGMNRPGKV